MKNAQLSTISTPTTTSTDPCTARLARGPKPQSDSTRLIRNGTTLYCCFPITLGHNIYPQAKSKTKPPWFKALRLRSTCAPQKASQKLGTTFFAMCPTFVKSTPGYPFGQLCKHIFFNCLLAEIYT